jgi:hypothetical protein
VIADASQAAEGVVGIVAGGHGLAPKEALDRGELAGVIIAEIDSLVRNRVAARLAPLRHPDQLAEVVVLVGVLIVGHAVDRGGDADWLVKGDSPSFIG